MREELLKGLEEFGSKIESQLKLVRFEINYDKDLPFIRDGIYILPKGNGKAEVFIYPKLLGVRIVDITPLFEKVALILESKKVKSVKEVESFPEPAPEPVQHQKIASEKQNQEREETTFQNEEEEDLSDFDEVFKG